MIFLADIGGTHARFATVNDESCKELCSIKKYKAADFPSLEVALSHYCNEHGLNQGGNLRLATAAHPTNHIWYFVNENKWIIDPEALKKQGWNVEIILNDFEAATWGLSTIPNDSLHTLKSTKNNDQGRFSRCLLGPGTGLGLGFLVPLSNSKYHVQPTNGGHMLASAMSDEQRNVIKTIASLQTDTDMVVFENLASGPGLHMIYRVLCQINNTSADITGPQDMLSNLDIKEVSNALRLFHEFLGLFSHMAVVTGHAYGGLYLTGGVIDRLVEADLFDFKSFHKYFLLPNVPSVKRAIDNTPIYLVKDQYLAMNGLLNV